MNGKECFQAWAGDHEWSDWTKPTLFASGFGVRDPRAAADGTLDAAAKVLDSMVARGTPSRASDGSLSCVVVDCPGDVAIAVGARLVPFGFAPVLLFNGVTSAANPLLRNDEVLDALASLAARTAIPGDPAPAFLLDSRRQTGAPLPGQYDNRWLTFPQDFPSAGRLKVSGVKRCYLVAEPNHVADDLAHVLRRWQDEGIEILDARARVPTRVDVREPLWFRQVFYRWVALTGLKPNAFGGFGAAVPQAPTRRAGGFYYG